MVFWSVEQAGVKDCPVGLGTLLPTRLCSESHDDVVDELVGYSGREARPRQQYSCCGEPVLVACP